MDQRISKTKENIIQTFYKLSKSMKFESITITLLCQEARISRSTFYQHFIDLYALLENIEADSLTKLNNLSRDIETIDSSKDAMLYILSFLELNKIKFYILYKNAQYTNFIKCMNDIVFEMFISKATKKLKIQNNPPNKELQYIIEFVTAGCYHTYVEIITSNTPSNLDFLAEKISILSDACLFTLLS